MNNKKYKIKTLSMLPPQSRIHWENFLAEFDNLSLSRRALRHGLNEFLINYLSTGSLKSLNK